ncbi:MAG: hypothetical protein IKV86_06000 [Clostridia bacterium]|nr:hypothetical protein [Clostridia bacterium]
MNSLLDMTFKRKFCVNLFKNTKLMLAKMTFTKDWLTTDRGNAYPIISSSGNVEESICCNNYVASSTDEGEVKRLIGQYTPFATYDITVKSMDDGCVSGVSINCDKLPDAKTLDVYIKRVGDKVIPMYSVDGKALKVTEEEFEYAENMSLVVTSHHGNRIDMLLRYGDYFKKVAFFAVDRVLRLKNERIFKNATASLYVGFENGGRVLVSDVSMYIDAGMSQADMKPVRYEDGQPLTESGKLYMTMTCRLGFEMYQSVLSWNPSTCDFNLEGVLFFDAGDGDWCGDVASSLIYDRNEGNWKIWMASFSHGHILGHAQFENDPRFGINVIDVTLMDKKEGSLDTEFFAKEGDEDPDMYFDKESGKWYMTICRSDSMQDGKYSYFLFESEKPFSDYKFVSKSFGDAVTGGMFTKIAEKRYFVCGANFDKRSQYNVYDALDFTKCTHLKCDFDDGAFRGWGTIIPVPCGTRTKYVWITFDRHNASDYNWSYGTLYVYESDLMNKGYEW